MSNTSDTVSIIWLGKIKAPGVNVPAYFPAKCTMHPDKTIRCWVRKHKSQKWVEANYHESMAVLRAVLAMQKAKAAEATETPEET